MIKINSKSKKAFWTDFPLSKKNWYRDVMIEFLNRGIDVTDEDVENVNTIIKSLDNVELQFSNDHRIERFITRIYKFANLRIKWEISQLYIGRIDQRISDAFASSKKGNARYIAISLGFSNIIDILPCHSVTTNLLLFKNKLTQNEINILEQDKELGIKKLLCFTENQFDKSYYDKKVILANWNYFNLTELKKSFDFHTFLLYCSIYYFIILQEIGHHILGHTGNKEKKIPIEILNIIEKNNYNGMSKKHKQELYADLYAFITLIKFSRKEGFPIDINSIIMGIILSFIGLSFTAENITQPTPTHPSLIIRIKLFIAALKEYNLNEILHECNKFLIPYIDFLSRNAFCQLSEIENIIKE